MSREPAATKRRESLAPAANKIGTRAEKDEPFVVTGDLDSGEGNVTIKSLKAAATIDGAENALKLRDTFRVVKPGAKNVGTAHGFNGGTGGNKIDYAFVPAGQKVIGASIDHFNKSGRYPSDHFSRRQGVIVFASTLRCRRPDRCPGQ